MWKEKYYETKTFKLNLETYRYKEPEVGDLVILTEYYNESTNKSTWGIIPFTGEENGIGDNIEMNTDKNKELEFQKKNQK